jgi:diaminohydroxyphosphoribosylaminopyrimidine deaminase/5-amino-6-(5-phosphoribosylamino)uracil reductase
MTPNELELAAMRRAIALSALGLGTTSPNPPVGCVILDTAGAVVGQGYHERKGGPHAEAHALAEAGSRAAGGTAVVTLEPCNHHGRTPPCHQALIDAGLTKVVIAVIDPTSRDEGGAARMREAGLDVEVGVLEDEAELVLRPWLTGLARERPWVVWAYGMSGEGAGPHDGAAVVGIDRSAYDAVLLEDGLVEEGRPNGHGDGVFAVGSSSPAADSLTTLRNLYDGGVRTLLISGQPEAAGTFLSAGLIDAVQVAIGPGARPEQGPWSVLPPGFALRQVQKTNGQVVLHAEKVSD